MSVLDDDALETNVQIFIGESVTVDGLEIKCQLGYVVREYFYTLPPVPSPLAMTAR